MLVVRDVAVSVTFYRRLGFAAEVEWDTYAKLVNGSAVLHLAGAGDPPADRPGLALLAPDTVATAVTAAIVLHVDDCRLSCTELIAEGVALLSGPAEPEWGGEVRAFLRDPDGHLIEIHETTAT